jgi:hypothetical protein
MAIAPITQEASQHRLQLTAFGVGLRWPFGRKGDFTPSRLARPGGG